MGQAYPPIRDLADIEAIERRPLGDYIEHWNTPDLIRAGAALEAGKMALHYLPSGDLAEKPRSFTFDELIRDATGKVAGDGSTQTADAYFVDADDLAL